MLDDLYEVLLGRKQTMPAGSYTAQLFREGEEEILRKIHEESLEVIQAAKGETVERLTEEVADLFYHLLVLLVERDLPLETVWAELRARR